TESGSHIPAMMPGVCSPLENLILGSGTSGWLQPSAVHLPATFLFLGNARDRSLIVGPSPRFRFVVGAFRPHRSVSDTTDLNRFAADTSATTTQFRWPSPAPAGCPARLIPCSCALSPL